MISGRSIITGLCFAIITLLSFSSFKTKEDRGKLSAITQEEQKLFKLINNYRIRHGLRKIAFSKSLSYVARQHSIDQSKNTPKKRCNLHSWSRDGEWSSCCYTPDHKKASCMWDKPRELTNYQGDGFEISAFSTEMSPEEALQLWKKSPGHNNMILNKKIWRTSKWKAMGVGIHNGYANVWFGEVKDQE